MRTALMLLQPLPFIAVAWPSAARSEAVNVFSMEVADVLSARAVEVSFASALSVVTAASDSSSGATADGTSSGGGHPLSNLKRSSEERPRSTPPVELSHMLKSQLLDYVPADMGTEERGPSSLGGMPMLQHSHTINVASLRMGSRDVGSTLDAAVERVLHLDVGPTDHVLRRFSSTSAASRGKRRHRDASCLIMMLRGLCCVGWRKSLQPGC
jgi:hypothetical protein